MATSYKTIYERFLSKINDPTLGSFDDTVLTDVVTDYFNAALARTRSLTHDLSQRDDDLEEFQDDLTNVEIELIADTMKLAWLEQRIHSAENVDQAVFGKEENFYSQANHLSTLITARDTLEEQINRLHCYNTFLDSEYFD